MILLTADAAANSAERMRRLGTADHLTKPLNVGQFLEVVRSYMAEPRGH